MADVRQLWALSPYDSQSHALPANANYSLIFVTARCGPVLPTDAHRRSDPVRRKCVECDVLLLKDGLPQPRQDTG